MKCERADAARARVHNVLIFSFRRAWSFTPSSSTHLSPCMAPSILVQVEVEVRTMFHIPKESSAVSGDRNISPLVAGAPKGPRPSWPQPTTISTTRRMSAGTLSKLSPPTAQRVWCQRAAVGAVFALRCTVVCVRAHDRRHTLTRTVVHPASHRPTMKPMCAHQCACRAAC